MSVWASAANLSRSGSELSNLRTEQTRLLTQNNSLTTTRAGEKNGRAQQFEEDNQKVADKAAEAKSADKADSAANLGIISAALGMGSTIAKGAAGGGGISGMDIVNGLLAISQAILEKFKTAGEKDILNQELGRLKGVANAEAKAVRALDQNPQG